MSDGLSHGIRAKEDAEQHDIWLKEVYLKRPELQHLFMTYLTRRELYIILQRVRPSYLWKEVNDSIPKEHQVQATEAELREMVRRFSVLVQGPPAEGEIYD